MIEGGLGVFPQIFFLVIFIQNDAILGNINGVRVLGYYATIRGFVALFETHI